MSHGVGPTVEASHNAAADLALKALADSGVKIGAQPQQKVAKDGAASESKNATGPRTLVSVNAKKKQKAAAAAANASAAAGNATAAKSVSINGREAVVDAKAKDDLKS